MNILAVDDNSLLLQSMELFFLGSGMHLKVVDNGREALVVARKKKFDVILLDVDMPGLSGFDVCKELKADLTTRDIPIIFITGRGDQKTRSASLQLGGADFIVKPFDVWELRRCIKSVVMK